MRCFFWLLLKDTRRKRLANHNDCATDNREQTRICWQSVTTCTPTHHTRSSWNYWTIFYLLHARTIEQMTNYANCSTYKDRSILNYIYTVVKRFGVSQALQIPINHFLKRCLHFASGRISWRTANQCPVVPCLCAPVTTLAQVRFLIHPQDSIPTNSKFTSFHRKLRHGWTDYPGWWL